MSIQRFDRTEDAREALWLRSGDPRLVPRIRSLWAFASRLAPGSAPRGVRKFRSPEEAERDRDEWVARRALALRAARCET
jgi:hypothetical protein